MITKAKVIQDLNYIRNNTPVKFKSFGGFFLKLMMLPVKDQEFIVDNLKHAALQAREIDMIEIISFTRPQVNLKESEQQFRFIIEHKFRCTLCSCVESGGTNSSSRRFKSNCEICYDKATEYHSDSVANQLYD